MNTTQKGIAMLLRSGVTGEKLVLPEDFVLADAFELLCRHSVAPLAYQGALNCGYDQKDEVMVKLLRTYLAALVRSEKQLRALSKLFAGFEAQKIPFMPFKGCNMKKIYPQHELRAMGDADILIHPEDHEKIRAVMEENGFAFELESDHVYVWRSDALMVELHKSMIPPHDEDYYAHYGTGWRLAQASETSRFDLSPEDAYLFMFTHFARHYRFSGIGCRHVTDLFVYRRAYQNLDQAYIAAELEALGLAQFHSNAMRMIKAWFADGQEDEVTELMTAFIYSGGNWGSLQNHVHLTEVKNAQKRGEVKHTRAHATLQAFFPPLSAMTSNYRYLWLKKYPILLPVSWMMRAVDIVVNRPKNIGRKLKNVNKLDDQSVLDYQQALQKVGLSFGKIE